MPQDDYNVANDSGANTRTDFNNQLAATVQNNSGATEPSTMFAHMLWADTSPSGYSIFKVRNAANAAWATCFDDEGRWKGIDGSASEPSMSFGSDVDTGLYRVGANEIGVTLGGTLALTMSPTSAKFVASTLSIIRDSAASVITQIQNSDLASQPGAHAIMQVDVLASGGGDAYSQVGVVGGQRYTFGYDRSDSEKFVFSRTSVLGTSNVFEIDTNGDIVWKGAVSHTPVTITTDTTPTAVGRRVIIIGAWTAANNITDFDNETAGQLLTILGGDSDCNVVDGAPIQLVGGTAWNGAAGATLVLLSAGGVWYELSRSDAS